MAVILTPINQVASHPTSKRERELIQQLRVMLKDLPQDVNRTLNTLVEEDRGERWSDMQLLIYLQQAIADINAEPAHTSYELDNFPEPWKACVINGSMIFALIAEGILQVGEQFSYSDNGISLSINLAQGYQSMAQMLLAGYTQLKKDIKRAMRPTAAGVKSSPAPVRIRSYAPRQWTYR
ncbi:gp165 [Bacillus phage G]|uniref:Gp165 n=1 Tax=Bacillus phage G TaxID=2884420 RepID=G3MBN1_9CAUD|nr:gp165 [Bacillus phage G]AEO93425.1 gp165 [Bacillus phage G]